MEEQAQAALASKAWEDLHNFCEDAELANGGSVTAESGFLSAMQIMCSMLLDNANNARYVWKRAPQNIREHKDVGGAWEVAKAVLKSDYAGMFSRLDSHAWSPFLKPFVVELREHLRQKMQSLVSRGYSSITVAQCGALMGLSQQDILSRAVDLGWKIEGDMVHVKDTVPHKNQKASLEQLQQLTAYINQLEA